MPKIKMPKGNPSLDMTPMVDLAFLLVTFFMLTASVRMTEPVIVDTPDSHSDKLLPENVIMLTVDKRGKAYFNISNVEVRTKTLERMGKQYNMTFTPAEIKAFGKMTSFGVPMNQLKKFIALSEKEKEKFVSPGVPLDSLDNQLSYWIRFGHIQERTLAKEAQEKAKSVGRTFKDTPLRFAIKADGQSNFLNVKDVIKVLTDNDIYVFNLITNLEKGDEKK
jgi:biopolymer transport protein ExbD